VRTGMASVLVTAFRRTYVMNVTEAVVVGRVTGASLDALTLMTLSAACKSWAASR